MPEHVVAAQRQPDDRQQAAAGPPARPPAVGAHGLVKSYPFLVEDIGGGYFDKSHAAPVSRTSIALARLAEAVKGRRHRPMKGLRVRTSGKRVLRRRPSLGRQHQCRWEALASAA